MTIDPNATLLSLAGYLIAVDSGAEFPITQQKSNSLRTRYDGSIVVVLNKGTIYFPGGSTIDARQQTSGNFQPNTLPADYGGKIVLIPNALQIDAAARNVIGDARSAVLALDANGHFTANGVTMLLTSGSLDYAITGNSPSSYLLSGFSSDNQATGTGTLTVLPGQLKIDIPVVQNLSSEVPGISFVVDMTISGQITATKDVPELLDHYKLQVQAGQTVTVRTSTPLDNPLGNPRNDLDAYLTVLDPSLVAIATDDDSAGDGRNASLTFIATTTGTYTIQVAALAGNGEYVLTTEVFDPPVANAGGPYSITEGSPLTLDGSLSQTNNPYVTLAYSWDINGDGVFGDATGVAPTLSWSQLIALGIQDGASLRSVTVQVSDGIGHVVQASSLLQVNNSGPAASVSGASTVIRGMEAVFTLYASDPSPVDQAASFTFNIDWDGDGSVDQTVNGSSGTQVTHVFANKGHFAVKVSATDKDGNTGGIGSFDVDANAFGLVVDGDDVHLVYFGSAGDDHVEFEQIDEITISVHSLMDDGVSVNLVESVSGVTGVVIAVGAGGDDQLVATGLITKTAYFLGGIGNDTLRGGSADDQLFGEDDVDDVFGGLGHDLVDGGGGDDLLYGEWENPEKGTVFGIDTILGGDGNDTIHGDGDGGEGTIDLIYGDAGDDLIYGDGNVGKKTATDTIHGGLGNDTIYGDSDGGESAADLIHGEEDNDVIFADGSEGGDTANDTVFGGSGDDILYGDGGEGASDSLMGEAGNDIIDTGHGSDYADGGEDDDLILGDDGGEGADDTLIGNDGNDMLVGGSGSDSLDGGTGEDLLIVSNYLPATANSAANIFSEWSSARPFADRVANIQGVGVGPRNNGDDYLIAGSTVTDDAAIDTVLASGSEEDWLFLKLSQDLHPDVGIEDIVTGL
ncbi:MAG: PKD domain-containing protein [Planctomycetota bacterium]